ncbi:MAG: acyltransferase [Steroidobacteraceae bacterium]
MRTPDAPASHPMISPETGREPRVFFHSLDGIRAVAAFMVVMLHTAPLFGIARPQESYLAVDLFFGLSGVVISHTYEARLLAGLSLARFCWIRIVRLYPLYAAGTAIGIATLAFPGGDPGTPDLGLLLPLSLAILPFLGSGSAAYFPLNIPGWSLFLELLVNVLYAGIVRRLDRRALLIILCCALAGLVFCVRAFRFHSLELGWRQVPWRGLDLGVVGGLLRVAYSFFAGVLLYRAFSGRQRRGVSVRPAAWVPWLIVMAVALILAASPGPVLRPFFDLTVVAVVFPALIYLALWFRSAGAADPLFKMAGNLSYAIYAIHYPLSMILDRLAERWMGLPLQRFAPWGGIGFLASLLILCAWLDRYYDRPLRSALMRRAAAPAPVQNCQ